MTVNEFETRMATFFERLLAEEDPTRIATMAETMPEPPDLAAVAASIPEPGIASFDPASRGDWVRSMPEATALDHADEPPAAPAVADHTPRGHDRDRSGGTVARRTGRTRLRSRRGGSRRIRR